jgi:hypothetical protein
MLIQGSYWLLRPKLENCGDERSSLSNPRFKESLDQSGSGTGGLLTFPEMLSKLTDILLVLF